MQLQDVPAEGEPASQPATEREDPAEAERRAKQIEDELIEAEEKAEAEAAAAAMIARVRSLSTSFLFLFWCSPLSDVHNIPCFLSFHPVAQSVHVSSDDTGAAT